MNKQPLSRKKFALLSPEFSWKAWSGDNSRSHDINRTLASKSKAKSVSFGVLRYAHKTFMPLRHKAVRGSARYQQPQLAGREAHRRPVVPCQ